MTRGLFKYKNPVYTLTIQYYLLLLQSKCTT